MMNTLVILVLLNSIVTKFLIFRVEKANRDLIESLQFFGEKENE